MSRFLLIAALLLVTPVASCDLLCAQAVGIDTTGAAPGRYLIIVSVSQDGSVHAKVVTNVVTINPGTGGGGEPTPPVPTPPSDPDETLTTTIARRSVERVTDPNKAMNARKLALVYATIASQKDALKTVENMQGATRQAAKIILGDALDAWRAWVQPVEVHLKQLETDGHLQTVDQVAEQYRQIAKGLESQSAASGPQQLNPDNVRMILELIMMILKMFMGGGGLPGGGGN